MQVTIGSCGEVNIRRRFLPKICLVFRIKCCPFVFLSMAVSAQIFVLEGGLGGRGSGCGRCRDLTLSNATCERCVVAIAKRTMFASSSLVTLSESEALGIGGLSAGRFVTGTMEYLAAARSCLALCDGRTVQEPKIQGWRSDWHGAKGGRGYLHVRSQVAYWGL